MQGPGNPRARVRAPGQLRCVRSRLLGPPQPGSQPEEPCLWGTRGAGAVQKGRPGGGQEGATEAARLRVRAREGGRGGTRPGRGRRSRAAHLRVGHHQALVALAVVPPFILVHLRPVHPPGTAPAPRRPVRSRAGGPPAACSRAPVAAVGGGARPPVTRRRRRRLRCTPAPGRTTTRRAPPEATPPSASARAEPGNFRVAAVPCLQNGQAEGPAAFLSAGKVTHFRCARFRKPPETRLPASAPEVRSAGGSGG